MSSHSEPDWVPKVHPMSREMAPEDPMELVATRAPGDPDYMLQCITQEFAWMGCGMEELLALFRSPAYPVLNELLAYYGEDEIRQRVREILGRLGTFRFQETIDDEPEPEDDEPELVQLSLDRLQTTLPSPLYAGERGWG
jgi:hypothetical protein